jgi:hypothetical protein
MSTLRTWLPTIVNIVCTFVRLILFLLKDRASAWALIKHVAVSVASMAGKMLAALKAKPPGELVFDASTGSLSGVAISNSTAIAHLTTKPPPQPMPHMVNTSMMAAEHWQEHQNRDALFTMEVARKNLRNAALFHVLNRPLSQG